MKLFKRIAVASAVILAVSFAGLQRLNYLSSKPINLDEFSWFNKVEIYGAYVVMNILGAPLYPEIAKEGLLMLLPSYKDQEVVFQSDFFLESAFIQDKITNYDGPVRLAWSSGDYVVGNPEARVALALNTGTLSLEDATVKVSVPFTWPKQSWIRLLDVSWLPEIKVQEGLFWVLEQEGWIYPYTVVWEADLAS
tara:strand:- start:1440 stop:2021 length:582 start_codon:yes stop_codon:yes gene_type:complete